VLADDDGSDGSGASAVTADEALAAASVTGRVPAGPALRRREPIKLRAGSDLGLTKALCATEQGFSLHAATTASAGDAAGREALCRSAAQRCTPRRRAQSPGQERKIVGILAESDFVRLHTWD